MAILASLLGTFVFAVSLYQYWQYILSALQFVFGYSPSRDPIYGRKDRQLKQHVHDQIRLLELQPGSWDAQIVCQLVVVGLGEKPKYRAISYVWGPRSNMKTITLDGKSFAVTPNLESALRRFRSTNTVQLLWADAICMNQKDEKERNDQVALMGEVYREAQKVLIWLGNGTAHDNNSVAMKGVKFLSWSKNFDDDADKIASYAKDFLVYHQTRKLLRHLLQQDYVLGAFCLVNLLARNKCLEGEDIAFFQSESVRQAIVMELKTIMELPWWDRQWVIQETVLAKEVIIYYQGFEAPWEMFSAAARNFQRHRQSCCADQNAKWPLADIQGIAKFARVFRDVDDWRMIWKKDDNRIRLLSLLWQFRSRTTTDPKDKVYALLPLVTDWKTRTGRKVKEIVPTYNASDARVFRQVVLNSIQVHESLIVLMGNTEKSSSLQKMNLPSWVPDWTVKPYAYELERLKRAELYSASGNRPPTDLFIGESFMLTKGVRHGEVNTVGGVMDADDEMSANTTFAEWYGIADMKRYMDMRYQSGPCTRGDAFCRTLCMNTETAARENDDQHIPLNEEEYVKAGDRYGQDFIAELKSATRSRHDSADLDDPDGFRAQFERAGRSGTNKTFATRTKGIISSDGEEGMEEPEEIEDNQQVKIDDAVLTSTAHRRFFMTKVGTMGLGPACMQKEDIVYVLDGGNTPFLLRPIKGRRDVPGYGEHECYQLVGDCYVHGIMYGEAVQDDKKIVDLYIV